MFQGVKESFCYYGSFSSSMNLSFNFWVSKGVFLKKKDFYHRTLEKRTGRMPIYPSVHNSDNKRFMILKPDYVVLFFLFFMKRRISKCVRRKRKKSITWLHTSSGSQLCHFINNFFDGRLRRFLTSCARERQLREWTVICTTWVLLHPIIRRLGAYPQYFYSNGKKKCLAGWLVAVKSPR